MELSKRYISDRFLPDKAIDLMDEAASRKQLQGYKMPDRLKTLKEEIIRLGEAKPEILEEPERYRESRKSSERSCSVRSGARIERTKRRD